MHRIATLAVLLAATPAQAEGATERVPELVVRWCGACHDGPEVEGDFALAPLFAAPTAATREPALADDAREALARLRSRTMPPDDAAAPGDADRAALTAAFAALLPSDDREVAMRRLSRREYANTLRDLTGVVVRAEALLPEDPRTYGFDNVGDAMTVSPLLFERYLDVAGAAAAAMLAEPAARERVFAAGAPLAATLAPFLANAFRRPLEPGELAERLALHDDLLAAGASPATAQAALLRSIFASPSFVFRVERGEPDAPHLLAAHELAVRLAYFATASMPDATLRAVAAAGLLADPDVVTAELQRLIAATGGRSLAESFFAQWLRYGDVATANADFRRYPQIWNGALRPSLFEEAACFFAGLVRDDADVLAVFDADHTWLDETLSRHYGFGDVRGARFVRVAAPDRRRGGILGMGAMLMTSSFPLRTSPVLRGKWILDQLLDEPPPPPPAGAGTLPADDAPEHGMTLRARLEHHRRDAACASCHARMDPLGFALENYDVLGRWRTELHGTAIDAAGELPDGTRLDGPIALKDALRAREADFVRTLVRRLLVYAIGRPLTDADEPEVHRVAATALAAGRRFSAVLAGVVTSPLFTHRIPPGGNAAAAAWPEPAPGDPR